MCAGRVMFRVGLEGEMEGREGRERREGRGEEGDTWLADFHVCQGTNTQKSAGKIDSR